MIEMNDHLSKIADHKLMTSKLQNELYAELNKLCPERLSDNGPETPPENCLPAVSQIAGHLYRLVISQAGKLASRKKKLTFDDLVQEGVVGLLIAIWKFDNAKGYKLTTYAVWWIRQVISRAIADQGRTIRIPVHVDGLMLKVSTYSKNYEKLNGSTPTGEEVKEALELSHNAFEKIARGELFSLSLSLDVLHNSHDHDSYDGYDFYISEDEGNNNYQSFLVDDIDCLLIETLNHKEEKIIRLRFGLTYDQDCLTLEEIAGKYGLTRERIRQIEKEALGKLREAGKIEALRGYL